MRAIILAAGMGKRLGKYTNDGTKCLVKVNGKSIIENAIDALLASGVEDIVIVVGYKASVLMEFVNSKYPDLSVAYVDNPVYSVTNNIYSLWIAREYMKTDDVILLESDVVFDGAIINELILSEKKNLAVISKFEPWMDGTVALLDSNDTIVEIVDKNHFRWDNVSDYFKTVNIYKFSKEFSTRYYVPFLDAYIESFGKNDYYEQVLKVLAYLENTGLKGFCVSARRWYEIDDPHDLHVAETIFGARADRLNLMHKRYGGFWRFPEMMDYCYLVNPYFPSDRMWEELGSRLREVTSQYPSGMAVQSLLAGKIFNVCSEMIAVGNGAAELIASLFRNLEGKVGIVDPCFNEYPARVGKRKIVRYDSGASDFAYTVQSVINCWNGKAEWAVLVNPDNPSGHFLSHAEVMSFVDQCAKVGIRPVVDESFVDFADEGNKFSLFDETYLRSHPELVVIRSISKSYGVPGLRLGVIASGDTELILRIKQDVAVWNINSLGELFLQIFDKYKKEYNSACQKIAEERVRFSEKLNVLPGVHVYPSQANYVLCKMTGRVTAAQLAERLYENYSMLIKDLNDKIGCSLGDYVRIAVRSKEENNQFLDAVAEVLNEIPAGMNKMI